MSTGDPASNKRCNGEERILLVSKQGKGSSRKESLRHPFIKVTGDKERNPDSITVEKTLDTKEEQGNIVRQESQNTCSSQVTFRDNHRVSQPSDTPLVIEETSKSPDQKTQYIESTPSDSNSVISDAMESSSTVSNRNSHCVKRSIEDFEDGEHVTIWNRTERRKIAGNAAPLAKNLKRYFEKHPDCEVYFGQDLEEFVSDGNETTFHLSTTSGIATSCGHVSIWNRVEKRKVAGNAAPLLKNLESYLRKHPECEVYNGQDKEILEQKKQNRRKSHQHHHNMRRKTAQRKHKNRNEPTLETTQENSLRSEKGDKTTPKKEESMGIVSAVVDESCYLSQVAESSTDITGFFGLVDEELCGVGYMRRLSFVEEAPLLDSVIDSSYPAEDLFLWNSSSSLSGPLETEQEDVLEWKDTSLSVLDEEADVAIDISSGSRFSPTLCLSSG